jgi:hypothetical protein
LHKERQEATANVDWEEGQTEDEDTVDPIYEPVCKDARGVPLDCPVLTKTKGFRRVVFREHEFETIRKHFHTDLSAVNADGTIRADGFGGHQGYVTTLYKMGHKYWLGGNGHGISRLFWTRVMIGCPTCNSQKGRKMKPPPKTIIPSAPWKLIYFDFTFWPTPDGQTGNKCCLGLIDALSGAA